MNPFKWRHFQGEIILGCVRWYCKYGISYRDLEEMMEERGVDVDHTTIYRWVQCYAPEMERRLRYFWKPTRGFSWRVDETYVKVRGQWKYLYRAITKEGETIDFYLSSKRNLHAAKTFLAKALRSFKDYEQPRLINTDKAPAYSSAITELKEEGRRLDHCVYSYGYSCASGRTSIWSLQEIFPNNSIDHLGTIEVANAESRIVQFRAKYNREPKPKAKTLLKRWASENGLSLARWL